MFRRAMFLCLSFCLALTSALAQEPQPGPGRITGKLMDTTGATVNGATVVLSTPEGETVAITIATASGDYSFPALRPAEYVVQVFAVGFGPSRLTRLHVSEAKDTKQDIAMDIGFVRNANSAAAKARNGTVTNGTSVRMIANPNISVTSDGTRRVRITTITLNEDLIRQSEPVYPADAKAARIEGTVIVEATIGLDGSVIQSRPVSGPRQLQQAAADSVRTWRYKPQIVNGSPSEVVTMVSVKFAVK